MSEQESPQSESEELLGDIRAAYKEAKKHTANWRTEAVESYDFVAGRQWSEEDRATLEEQNRPMVTFNRMGPYFDAVSGSQINNRQEIKYLPRTTADTKQNEILTEAVRWVYQQTNGADEETEAFYDVLVAGMGWIETQMDYEDNPDGMVRMSRVDPLEMYWDPTAKQKNLLDAKWIQRVKWLSKEEIEDKWPDLEIGVATTPWGDEGETKEPHNASLAFLYRENSTTGYDEKSGKYRVVQHLYWDKDDIYRVQDPQTGALVKLSAEKFKLAEKMAQAQGFELRYVKQKAKIYRYAFVVGDKIAEEGELKCGFNIKCITGKRDRNTNTWYGLSNVMKDPQRWANKFLAQIMHIVNSNAKGGLLAEEGAFKDIRKAEENWSDPTAIITLKNGGLQKIKERQQSQYPAGLDKLLQFAVSSIPDATGINVEFLGAADRQQAGVLEAERKKSAYIILAGFFNSLSAYRKEQGKLLAHFVKEYLNDGRVIRITTDQGEMAVPLNLTDEVIEYDVIVSEAPNSPNLKEEVWGALGQLIPQFLKAGIQIPPEILKFSPLPDDLARSFAQKMSGQLPPQVQQQIQEMQQTIQKLEQDNFRLKNNDALKQAKLASSHELGKESNAIAADAEAKKLQAELITLAENSRQDLLKLRAETEAAAVEANRKFELDLLKAQLDEERKARAEERKARDEEKKSLERLMAAQPKESKSSEPVINITNVIPEPKAKNVKVERGANGELIGATVD